MSLKQSLSVSSNSIIPTYNLCLIGIFERFIGTALVVTEKVMVVLILFLNCMFKNYLADTPLRDNHFAKKPLADMGGPPPPLTDNPQKFF